MPNNSTKATQVVKNLIQKLTSSFSNEKKQETPTDEDTLQRQLSQIESYLNSNTYTKTKINTSNSIDFKKNNDNLTLIPRSKLKNCIESYDSNKIVVFDTGAEINFIGFKMLRQKTTHLSKNKDTREYRKFNSSNLLETLSLIDDKQT